MSFVSILCALLLEQAQPLSRGNPIHSVLRAWVRWAGRSFDAGRPQHAALAWSVAVVLPSVASVLVYWALLETVGWPVAVLWNIAVLYVTLGFRQFSHHFTGIRNALEAGDEDNARRLLAHWQQADAGGLAHGETLRQVIAYSVIAAHRHVFGVLAWFSVLAAMGLGPSGAVFYRLGEFVPRYWIRRGQVADHPVSAALLDAATRCWYLIDWIPARITAIGFAVVGSFEEAIESWRGAERSGLTGNDGVILAATAGAVNLRLGASTIRPVGPIGVTLPQGEGSMSDTAAGSIGQEPEVGHLRTVVGLVWRTVLMWMILLALLTLARLLG